MELNAQLGNWKSISTEGLTGLRFLFYGNARDWISSMGLPALSLTRIKEILIIGSPIIWQDTINFYYGFADGSDIGRRKEFFVHVLNGLSVPGYRVNNEFGTTVDTNFESREQEHAAEHPALLEAVRQSYCRDLDQTLDTEWLEWEILRIQRAIKKAMVNEQSTLGLLYLGDAQNILYTSFWWALAHLNLHKC